VQFHHFRRQTGLGWGVLLASKMCGKEQRSVTLRTPSLSQLSLERPPMKELDAANIGTRHDDVGAFDDHGTTHELIFKPLSRQGSKESLCCEDVAECAAVPHSPCDSHGAFELLTSDKDCNGSALLRRSPATPHLASAFYNEKRVVQIIGHALQCRIEEKMATIELLQKLAQLESTELEMNPDAADAYALPRTRRRFGGLRGRRGLPATADSSSTEEETSTTAAATTTHNARADPGEQVKETWTQLRAEMRIVKSIQNLYASTPVPATSEQWVPSNEHRLGSAQALRMTQENCNW